MRHRVTMVRPVVSFLVLFSILVVGACQSPEEIKMQKAEQALRDTMAAGADVETYGLRVIGDGSASITEVLIVENLSAVSPKTATAAAEAARKRRLTSQTEALKTLFATKVGAPQIEAAHALAILGDEEALQWLRDEAGKAEGVPSQRVLEALIDAGETEVVRAALEKTLQSTEQTDRDQAYMTLATIEEPWVADVVVRGLKKEHGAGREQAIRALGKVGDASHAYQIQRFINTRGLVYATIEALGELGDENSVAEIRKMAKRPEKLVQIHAAAALWKLGNAEEGKAMIEPLLTSEDTALRFDLAKQLAGVDDAMARQMLAYLAEEDPDGQVRKEALRALYDAVGEEALPVLMKCASDADYQVAVVALGGLARVADAAAIPTLEPLLDNQNPYVVVSAANAIIEILDRTVAKTTS